MAPSSAAASPNKRTYARFTDARSATGRDAEAFLALSGVEITTQNPIQRYVWPYASLRANQPIRPAAVDVLLSSATTAGATAFVPSAEFAAELAKRAPHLTASAARWRHTRPWVLGIAGLIALGALISASGWTPARTIATFLPESWRDRLGEAAIESLTEGHKKCVDAEGLAAVGTLSERLSRASGTETKFEVVVYDWPLMNAFTVPGDKIVLTKGLIDKAGGADEIAGVLAHEMGHAIKLHPEASVIRAIGFTAVLELMMGGSGGALANIGAMLAQFSYTRRSEREADAEALRLLKGAQISPRGLGEFFRRVQDEENQGDFSRTLRKFDILRTHPQTAARAEQVRQQPDYPATAALGPAQWEQLKAICRKIEAPEPPSDSPRAPPSPAEKPREL